MSHRGREFGRPRRLLPVLVLCALAVLVALPGDMAAGKHPPTNPEVSSLLGDSRSYPRRYYPNAPSEAEAVPIVLLPGDEFGATLSLPSIGVTVRGRVLGEAADGGDPQPLPGALVQILHGGLVLEGLSDPSGEYTLEGVPAGHVHLRIATDDPRSRARRHHALYYPGVEDAEQATPLLIEGAAPVQVGDFTLPLGVDLSGHVRTPDDGEPLGGIPVTVTERTSLRTWRSVTNAGGYFWQGGLGPGDYVLFADSEGTPYVAEYHDGARTLEAATPLTLGAGDVQAGLVIQPDLGGTITGRILTDLGQPLIDTDVQVIERNTERRWVVQTNVAGVYVKNGLHAAQYLVYVPLFKRYFPDEPRQEDARPITVVEGEVDDRIDVSGSVPADCVLPPAAQGVIRGNLDVDYARTPQVVVRAASARDTVEKVMTNGNLYTLECVPEGDYQIAAFAQGGYRRQFYPDAFDANGAMLVTVDADTVEAIDLLLEESVVIETQVVEDAGASPLEAVRVVAREDVTGIELEGRTGFDGRVRFEVLPDGTGLPAGNWILYADSTVVPDPDVTPVFQPELEAEVLAGGQVRLQWRLSPEIGWSYRVTRHQTGEAAAAGHLVTLGETSPGGPERFDALDDPGNTVVTYRLDVRAIGEPIAFETWSNVLEPGSGGVDESSWRLVTAPSPWGRSGALRVWLQSASSSVATPGPIESLSWHSADGRRLEEMPWSSQGSGKGLELHVEAEAAARLSAGVYFLNAQGERGRTIARGVVVISR